MGINFKDDCFLNEIEYNNYINPETRCDFWVDEKRKKIWLVLLDLYNQIKTVCEKYGIVVRASGGTLLGAIRHGGFIPWDDDLDVALSRDDFNKLCSVASNEFSDPYFFQYALSDKSYFIGYARLRRNDTTGIIKYSCDYIYNNGIFVDIYVYDKAPLDNIKLKKHLKKVNRYGDLLNNYYHIQPRNNNFSRFNILRKIIIRKIFSFFVSYEALYKKYLKVITKYNATNSNRYVFFCSPKFWRYEATVDGFKTYQMMKFEFLEIAVPSDYDFELRCAYGDYKEFPKKAERGKWHEKVIIFDPDIPYIEYMKNHSEEFKLFLSDLTQNK